MARKRTKRGQGSIYERNGVWWCDYSVDGEGASRAKQVIAKKLWRIYIGSKAD